MHQDADTNPLQDEVICFDAIVIFFDAIGTRSPGLEWARPFGVDTRLKSSFDEVMRQILLYHLRARVGFPFLKKLLLFFILGVDSIFLIAPLYVKSAVSRYQARRRKNIF